MLQGNDTCATDGPFGGTHDLGFGRKRQVDSGRQRHDGRQRWLVGIVVVAQRAPVEDAVHALEVADGGVLKADLGFVDAFGQLGCVLVEVLEIVLVAGFSERVR